MAGTTSRTAAISPVFVDDAAVDTSVSRSLSLIDAIEITRVVKRDGHHRFVLDVYVHKTHAKAPLMLISPTELFFRTRQPRRPQSDKVERADEPDYQVEHRFSEFVELRDELHALATAAHPNLRDEHIICTFCSPLLECVLYDKRRPRTSLQLLASSNRRMSSLSTFVRRVVRMITDGNQRHCDGTGCGAVLHAAALLEEFLRKPRGSSLGII